MAREKPGKNQDDFKRRNRGLVLRLLATGQCMSRIDLVHDTGLSKMTVSNIVSEMVHRGVLQEGATTAGTEQLGRRPIRLTFSTNGPKVLGLVVLRTRVEAMVCDLTLRVCDQKVVLLEAQNNATVLNACFKAVDVLMREYPNIVAIGAASVGPINVSRGTILHPFYFGEVNGIELVRLLKERYRLPIYFDHDSQSAALVEKLFGCGMPYNDILFVAIARGVGCGIISSGHARENKRGLSPEMGHVSIDYNGLPCVCGNRGCIEQYVNSYALRKKLCSITGQNKTFEEFCRMGDDPRVDGIFREAMVKLAVAIVSTANLLNPDLVILGRDSVYLDDRYIALLEEEINAHKFGDASIRILVRRARFGQDAHLYGAACNAIYSIFNGELVLEGERSFC